MPTHKNQSASTGHGALGVAWGELPSCYMKTLKRGVDYMVPRNQHDAHMLAVVEHEEV